MDQPSPQALVPVATIAKSSSRAVNIVFALAHICVWASFVVYANTRIDIDKASNLEFPWVSDQNLGERPGESESRWRARDQIWPSLSILEKSSYRSSYNTMQAANRLEWMEKFLLALGIAIAADRIVAAIGMALRR